MYESDWSSSVRRHLRESKMNISIINKRNSIHDNKYSTIENARENFKEPQFSDNTRKYRSTIGYVPDSYEVSSKMLEIRDARDDSNNNVFGRRQNTVNQQQDAKDTSAMNHLLSRLDYLEKNFNLTAAAVSPNRNQTQTIQNETIIPAITWQANEGRNNIYDNRCSMLEQNINVLTVQMDKLVNEMSESKKHTENLRLANTRQTEEIEQLKKELDLRRQMSIKAENSMRSTEKWSEEMEVATGSLRQQLRFYERQCRDYEEFMKTALTRSDLDSGVYLDKLTNIIQKNVLNSLSGWKYQIETKLNLTTNSTGDYVGERGENIPLSSASSGNYIDGKIQDSVDTAVHALSIELEDRIYTKALFQIRNDLKEVKNDCQERIIRLAALIGLEDSNTDYLLSTNNTTTSKQTERNVGMNAISISAVRLLEGNIKELSDKVHSVETSLLASNIQSEVSEKCNKVEISALRSRIEDCFHSNEIMVNTAKERASGVEHLVRLSDLSHKDELSKLTNDMSTMMNKHADIFTDEQNILRKKVMLMEKLVDSMVDKLSQTKKDTQSTIVSTPEYKKMLLMSTILDGFSGDISELREKYTEIQGNTAQMENTLNISLSQFMDFSKQYQDVENLSRQIVKLTKEQEMTQNSVTVLEESQVAINTEMATLVKEERLTEVYKSLAILSEKTDGTIKNVNTELKVIQSTLTNLSADIRLTSANMTADKNASDEKIRNVHTTNLHSLTDMTNKIGNIEFSERKTEHELKSIVNKLDIALSLPLEMKALRNKYDDCNEQILGLELFVNRLNKEVQSLHQFAVVAHEERETSTTGHQPLSSSPQQQLSQYSQSHEKLSASSPRGYTAAATSISTDSPNKAMSSLSSPRSRAASNAAAVNSSLNEESRDISAEHDDLDVLEESTGDDNGDDDLVEDDGDEEEEESRIEIERQLAEVKAKNATLLKGLMKDDSLRSIGSLASSHHSADTELPQQHHVVSSSSPSQSSSTLITSTLLSPVVANDISIGERERERGDALHDNVVPHAEHDALQHAVDNNNYSSSSESDQEDEDVELIPADEVVYSERAIIQEHDEEEEVDSDHADEFSSRSSDLRLSGDREDSPLSAADVDDGQRVDRGAVGEGRHHELVSPSLLPRPHTNITVDTSYSSAERDDNSSDSSDSNEVSFNSDDVDELIPAEDHHHAGTSSTTNAGRRASNSESLHEEKSNIGVLSGVSATEDHPLTLLSPITPSEQISAFSKTNNRHSTSEDDDEDELIPGEDIPTTDITPPAPPSPTNTFGFTRKNVVASPPPAIPGVPVVPVVPVGPVVPVVVVTASHFHDYSGDEIIPADDTISDRTSDIVAPGSKEASLLSVNLPHAHVSVATSKIVTTPSKVANSLDDFSSDDEMIPAEDYIDDDVLLPPKDRRNTIMHLASGDSVPSTTSASNNTKGNTSANTKAIMSDDKHVPTTSTTTADGIQSNAHTIEVSSSPSSPRSNSPVQLTPLAVPHAQLPPLKTTGLSIKERLLLRQEQNKKEKELLANSSIAPVITTTISTATTTVSDSTGIGEKEADLLSSPVQVVEADKGEEQPIRALSPLRKLAPIISSSPDKKHISTKHNSTPGVQDKKSAHHGTVGEDEVMEFNNDDSFLSHVSEF